MTTIRCATEVWLTGNLKYDLKTSCLPTVMYVMRYFFHIFKNQNPTKNDAVKQGSLTGVHEPPGGSEFIPGSSRDVSKNQN